MTTINLPPNQAWTFSRLPALLERLEIRPGVVIHVGAHHGEEVDIYQQCGFRRIVLVEPDPRSLEVLYDRFSNREDITVIPAAAVAEELSSETAKLHYAQRSVWSSLTPHGTAHSQTDVSWVVLADLVAKVCVETDSQGDAVLILDSQGTELELLESLDVAMFGLVIVEASCRSHDSAAFWLDLMEYMTSTNWALVEEWVHDNSGYTDCVFRPAQ